MRDATLRIRLGPIHLKNPVIAGSSEFTMTEAGMVACLEAGAAAVVAKSVNESEAAARQLDIAEYVLLRPDWSVGDWDAPGPHDSLFNRSGLAQVRLDDWLQVLARADAHARERSSYVIGSITVGEPEPAALIAGRMAAAVRCLELNLGTPQGREAVGQAVRQIGGAELVREYTQRVRAAAPETALIVKLGQAGDVVALAQAALAAGADAVAMMGRFNGFLPDVETWEPVLGSWAAIGGPWSLPMSLYAVSKARRALGPEAPLVGTGGARGGLDVVRFLLSGARAVELVSSLLQRGPAALSQTISELEAYAARRGLTSLETLVGVAADRAREYSEIPPQVQSRPWDRHLEGNL